MKRVMSKYRKIKTAVYDRDGGQCVICGNTNVEAHHAPTDYAGQNERNITEILRTVQRW